MLKKPLSVKFQKDKKKVTVTVMPPDYQVEQALRVAYAKAYRRAIQQGVATRPSMLALMRKEGVWGPEQEEELTGLSVEAAMYEAALEGQTDFVEQKKLVLQLSALRSKIYEMVAMKMMPLEHTAEQIAEDVRLDTYVALCTIDENGAKYFKNVDDFLSRRHDKDAERIFGSVVGEMSKDNINMLRQLPEHEWLIENKFMDKEGNFLSQEFEEEMVEAGASVEPEGD